MINEPSIIIVLCFIIGYLFGSIQVPYFMIKILKGKDIREHGTGNAGASNVTVIAGWKYGIITAIGDILKAFIPAIVLKLMFINILTPSESNTIIVMSGCGSIIGHIFPFFMSFNGGKGIACYVGLLLAIDIYFGLISIVTIISITYITNYVSIGSIAMYVITPIIFLNSSNNFIFLQIEDSGIIFLLIIAIIGILKHVINIERIVNGTETGLSDVRNKK